LIVADTDIWVDYFEKPESATGQAMNNLIGQGRVAIAGPTLAELVRGIHTDEQVQGLAQMLSAVGFIDLDRPAWMRAGRIAEQLDRRGSPIPLNDVYIAAAALQGGHEVFSRNRHFERIPGLRLYQPGGDDDA
jgi:predicted nucleic acid-binding protein